MVLSINFIDNMPNINDVSITIKIPKKLIEIWYLISLKLSYTALAMIIGMLIKNEKSSASFLFTPTSNPQVSVEPLLEIPGRSASPCEMPIYNALRFVIGLTLSFLKSATSSNIAEIINPQTNDFVEKLFSKKLLKIKTIIMDGIVAIIKWRKVLSLTGWRIISAILFL